MVDKMNMQYLISIILLIVLLKNGHVSSSKKIFLKENISQQHLKVILVEFIFLEDISFIQMQSRTKCLMIYIC